MLRRPTRLETAETSQGLSARMLRCGGPLLLACVAWTGCGSDGVVPIEPRFLLDGQPLADASISFIRSGQEQGRPAFGVTDANGVAQLTTFKPLDGVLPGSYSVVVIKAPENPLTFETENDAAADEETLMRMSSMQDFAQKPRRKRVRTTIPEIYSDPGTTPLSCTVSSDTATLEFNLQSK